MNKTITTVLTSALLWLVVAAPTPVAAAELVLIVNTANPTVTLTAREAKAFFLKKKATWPNGEKVRPVDLQGESPERGAFLDQVLDISSNELKRYWLEQQYASASQPAAGVADEASVLKFVSFFKGGIGFVSKSALAGAAGKGVKPVLTVTF